MNVARALGMPGDVVEALALIQTARRVARIDLGQVNNRLFLEAAGVGITAGLLHLLGQLDAGRWQRLWTLLRYVRLARSYRLWLDLDGEMRSQHILSR